jgi:hypothetical protein
MTTMMVNFYSSTNFLVVLLIGFFIWNFNIALISSGLCQTVIRRWGLSSSYDDEVDEAVENRPLLSSRQAQLHSGIRHERRRRATGGRNLMGSNNENDYAGVRGYESTIISSNPSTGDDGDDDDGASTVSSQQQHEHNNIDHTVDDTQPTTEQELEQTYEVIYRPMTQNYMEGENSRSWMWLMSALLINIVCIRVELILFDSLLKDYDNDYAIITNTSNSSSAGNTQTSPCNERTPRHDMKE